MRLAFLAIFLSVGCDASTEIAGPGLEPRDSLQPPSSAASNVMYRVWSEGTDSLDISWIEPVDGLSHSELKRLRVAIPWELEIPYWEGMKAVSVISMDGQAPLWAEISMESRMESIHSYRNPHLVAVVAGSERYAVEAGARGNTAGRGTLFRGSESVAVDGVLRYPNRLDLAQSKYWEAWDLDINSSDRRVLLSVQDLPGISRSFWVHIREGEQANPKPEWVPFEGVLRLGVTSLGTMRIPDYWGIYIRN
jgi:hypothetical protein